MESALSALGAWWEAQPPSGEARVALTSTEQGWALRIGLLGTEAEGRGFVRIDEHRGAADWLTAWRTDEAWHGACGPRDVDGLIEVFLGWFHAAPEPVVVGPLGADLLARLAEVGVDEGLAATYGPDRVRWALDALDAASTRGQMVAPGAWIERLLLDNFGRPTAVVQRELPFAAAAARAAAPPTGTRWARERETGLLFTVLDVDGVRVQLAGNVAVPAHLWANWEWLTREPEGLNAPTTPAAEDPRRVALARMAAWIKLRKRLPSEIEEKLESLGLTLRDWADYTASP